MLDNWYGVHFFVCPYYQGSFSPDNLANYNNHQHNDLTRKPFAVLMDLAFPSFTILSRPAKTN